MTYLFKKFTKLALQYPDNSLMSLYNFFIDKLTVEEAQFCSKNFMIMIKAAECARNSPNEIKDILEKA